VVERGERGVEEVERVAAIEIQRVRRGREHDIRHVLGVETADRREQAPLGAVGVPDLDGVPKPPQQALLRELPVVEGVLLEPRRFPRGVVRHLAHAREHRPALVTSPYL